MKYSIEDILKKLKQTFEDEGIKISAYSYDADKKELHADFERFAPGVPAAFMIKGLQGTFRRYIDPEINVIADRYTSLPGAEKQHSNSSKELKNAILNGPQGNFNFQNMPCLKFAPEDDAHSAAESLENFVQMMKRRQLNTFAVKCPAKPSLSVLKQWSAINKAMIHKKDQSEDIYIVHCEEADADSHNSQCCSEAALELLPAGLFNMNASQGGK